MSDTVILLQEDCILAASGKEGKAPLVQKIHQIPIEGYGDPIDQWKEALMEYQQRYQPDKVKLILPGSYSSTRVTKIPFSSGRELEKMAANALAENASEETLSDYGVISSDRKAGVCICCASAEQNLLDRLLSMCKEIELKITGISVQMEGYLRVLDHLKEYRKKTEIYLLFEENSMTSILYQKGQYLYSTRSRIFSERGTLDFGTEIVRNISGILQFYSTQQASQPITDVYYAGCSADDFEAGEDGIRGMNLEVHPLKVSFAFEAEGQATDYLDCIGAMITEKKKKNVNLYQKWMVSQENPGIEKGELAKHFVFPAISLVVCLAVYGGIVLWNHQTQGEIDKINDWINSELVQTQYQKAKAQEEQSTTLASATNQVRQMDKNLDTYPDLTKEKIEQIEDVGGKDMEVRIQTMDADTGLLTFYAVSKEVIDIPEYVQSLEDTGLFESVDYSGYSYDDGKYSMTLSCVMKEEATEEDTTGGDAQ